MRAADKRNKKEIKKKERGGWETERGGWGEKGKKERKDGKRKEK